jgi:subtilisin
MNDRNPPGRSRRTEKNSHDATDPPLGGADDTVGGDDRPVGLIGTSAASVTSGALPRDPAERLPGGAPPIEPLDAAPRPIGPRRERYLVAPLGSGPVFDADGLFGRLAADPACTVHGIISPAVAGVLGPAERGNDPRVGSPFGAGPPVVRFPSVAVVEMDADRAAMFAAGPMVHVEPDLPLRYAEPGPTATHTFADPGVIPLGDEVALSVLVLGGDGKPLEGAEVYLMSETFPARGIAAADGRATLSLPRGALSTVGGVYVKPRFDYWAVWLGQPELTLDAQNLVTCPSFAETFPGFPARQLDGWARKAMHFDALPPTFRGHGTKVAIIDSGAAVGQPDLAGRFAGGRDIAARAGLDSAGWRLDTVGHGSHTAGIIGGTDNGSGIVGVVPEAELHACKIFPDGRFSDLLEAFDYCIAHDIDVVNLSLGSPQPSELLARKIEQARQSGIACVVAAGSSGGPVAFPASMPSVLAVAAIGKTGEYPPETYHATQVWGAPTSEGYFSATFTCFGPEVDVCAPGVAIVSSVPPANYAAWDGTSFAAPYVTGLAALLLAHHPDFRGRFAQRDAARVDRLFELIRGSCRPVQLGDPGRSGAGLPDAVVALGLMAPVAMEPPADPGLATLWLAMAHAGLITSSLPTAPFRPANYGPANYAPAGYGSAGYGWAGYEPAIWAAGSYPGRPTYPPPAHASMGTAPEESRTTGTAAVGGMAAASNLTGSATATVPEPTTLTPSSGDAMAPLRAAMRAAGLLSRPNDGDPPV